MNPDAKLETENIENGRFIPNDLDPQTYHPIVALKNAISVMPLLNLTLMFLKYHNLFKNAMFSNLIKEWRGEFFKGRTVWVRFKSKFSS